jgi:hypothetical protein
MGGMQLGKAAINWIIEDIVEYWRQGRFKLWHEIAFLILASFLAAMGISMWQCATHDSEASALGNLHVFVFQCSRMKVNAYNYRYKSIMASTNISTCALCTNS